MKVLFAHNYYGSSAPSGENVAYDCDVDLLLRRGHEVVQFTTNSDALRARPLLGRLRGAFSCIWNPFAITQLRAVIRAERPDILHVHNVFPRLSPAIFLAADQTPTATVLTLHNYRVFCAAGTALRNRATCTLCADRHSVLPALRYRCYRGMLPATVPVAASIALHTSRRTLSRHVDAFITLTRFQRDLLVAREFLPGDRVYVRANFMPGTPSAIDWEQREAKAVYIGRLADDKGVEVLIAAWKLWGPEAPRLDVVGDGPRRKVLERLARSQVAAGQVRFLGKRSTSEAHALLRSARLAVVPSRAFEGFPMVILEALAFGVPIVASEVGALSSIVADSGCGVAFPVGDAAALARAARALWSEPERMRRMASTCLDVYRGRYSESSAYTTLISVYQAAMRARRG